MSPEETAVTQAQFTRWVRDALNHLYDASYLEQHPLVPLLLTEGNRGEAGASQSLRKLMLDAIQRLRPQPGVPAQSPDWRAYHILELRYLEGLSRVGIMDELAVGKSQYFRDLRRVLSLLVRDLWQQHCAAGLGPAGNHRQMLRSETDRLAASARLELLNLEQALSALQPVLLPLTRTRGIALRQRPADVAPFVRADRVVLRQALLNLILYLVSYPDCRTVDMACSVRQRTVALHVRTEAPGEAAEPAQPKGLEACRQLMVAMEGALSLGQRGQWLEATLSWPNPNSRVLLVIDDNDELIRLYRRYLTNHGWQVVGATSGREALRTISETPPAAILLDVMMPEEDGWDVLVQLKGAAHTCDIPVIICSVVDQPELAGSLGAVASLPKPVTQKVLVDALSRLDEAPAGPASPR